MNVASVIPSCCPEVLVLRHGQTEWNAAGRLQGHLDSPLTEKGLRQARRQHELLQPYATINEFRNNHCGRGGSTHHLHHYNLWG